MEEETKNGNENRGCGMAWHPLSSPLLLSYLVASLLASTTHP